MHGNADDIPPSGFIRLILDWFILHIKESLVRIYKSSCIFVPGDCFSITTCSIVEPDEMLLYAAFHLDLHCY